MNGKFLLKNTRLSQPVKQRLITNWIITIYSYLPELLSILLFLILIGQILSSFLWYYCRDRSWLHMRIMKILIKNADSWVQSPGSLVSARWSPGCVFESLSTSALWNRSLWRRWSVSPCLDAACNHRLLKTFNSCVYLFCFSTLLPGCPVLQVFPLGFWLSRRM